MSETYQEILKRMQDKFEALSGYRADDASDIGIRLKVLAGEIFSAGTYAQWLKLQMFPQTAQGVQLDYHAQLRSLARKGAETARGLLYFTVEKEAAADLLIPKGCICSTQGKNPLRFETTEDGTIKKGNKAIYIAAQAVKPGAQSNVLPGTVTMIVTPPAGVTDVINQSAFSGGADAESDDELRLRILEHIKNIPNGTNRAFYKNAAESFEGVHSAGVVPRGRGAGTVDIYLAGKASAAGNALVKRVQEYMDSAREINVDVKVLPAQISAVSIYAAVQVRGGYEFEQVEKLCKEAVRAYFDMLGVGEDVRLSDVGEAIYHVPGVLSYQFDDYHTSDSHAQPSQLHVLKDVVITQREDVL